jgi:hypothetical protein
VDTVVVQGSVVIEEDVIRAGRKIDAGVVA